MRNSLLLSVVVAALAGCTHSPAAPPGASTTRPAQRQASDALPIVTPLPTPRPIEELEKAQLYTFNEPEVDAYIKHLRATEPDPIKRLVHLARKNVGQPYAIYLLGEYPYELYDPDPMYCLAKSDCVTFVEHTYSMALSKDWPTFFKLLQRLRYKNGQIGMVTRNHESVADWDPNNAWIFEDVTRKLGDGQQWVPLHLTWKPAKFFAKFGLGQDMPDVVMTDNYIPAARIPEILKDLREGDILHIVRGNEKEQYVGHFGLVTSGPNGTVNMLHSAQPAVREQPLMDFIEKTAGRTLGIKVLRPRQNMQSLADSEVKKPLSVVGQ